MEHARQENPRALPLDSLGKDLPAKAPGARAARLRKPPWRAAIETLGYNNLTKSLSLNLYDFAVALNDEERRSYVQYIDACHSARQIQERLLEVAQTLDAKVLSSSARDFQPHGASAVMLISEQPENHSPGPLHPATSTVNLHLDKSHICAHTYPEYLDPAGICTFRVDIDMATCGSISPLRVINSLLSHFDSDVIHIHYAVRGYARALNGTKVYLDHPMHALADALSHEIRSTFSVRETSHPAARSYHAVLKRTSLNTDSYFRYPDRVEAQTKQDKIDLIAAEIDAIANSLP